MKFNLRTPTDEELNTLNMYWLTPAISDHNVQSIRRNRLVMDGFQLQEVDNNGGVPEEATTNNGSDAVPEENSDNGRKQLKNWKCHLGFPTDEVLENPES